LLGTTGGHDKKPELEDPAIKEDEIDNETETDS